MHKSTNAVYCNMCGKKLDEFDLNQHFYLNKIVGYGSKYDGEEIRLRLCSDCMDDLIDSCAVSPVCYKDE